MTISLWKLDEAVHAELEGDFHALWTGLNHADRQTFITETDAYADCLEDCEVIQEAVSAFQNFQTA